MRVLFFVVLSVCIATPVTSQCVLDTTDPYRLPTTLKPNHYTLEFELGQDLRSFSGTIQMEGSVMQQTNCLVFSAAGLTIDNAHVDVVNVDSVSVDELHQQVVLHLRNAVPPGPVVVRMSYTGYANTQNATGFFRSSAEVSLHRASARKTMVTFGRRRISHLPPVGPDEEIMFATQFEGPYARMAMPVLDEPEYKATWEAAITVPASSKFDVTFNTPLLTKVTSQADNTIQHSFARTLVPMSNYLVSMAIGNFQFLKGIGADGCKYRIVSPVRAPAASSEYALNVTLKVVDYFTSLFGKNYACSPGNKLDQVAVPAIIGDAMEDWGNMMYSPDFLLVSADTAQNWKELVTQVISHELFHSWFGDTVTTPWWDQVFLQEGFARWFQYVVVDALYPEFHIFTQDGQFGFFQFAYNAMWDTRDSFGGTFAVVSTPEEIIGSVDSVQSAFSLITYGKGAALNQQISNFLGANVFGALLGDHLQRYQYTNPNVTDLMSSIQVATNFPAEQLFRPWLTTRGFPVVTVELNGTTLTLSQTPISSYLGVAKDFSWPWIPLLIESPGMDPFVYQLTDSSSKTTFAGSNVVVNSDHSAYAAVGYGQNDVMWKNAWQLTNHTTDTDWIVYIMQTHMITIHSHSKLMIGAQSLLQHFAGSPQLFGDDSWTSLVNVWARYGLARAALPAEEAKKVTLAAQISFAAGMSQSNASFFAAVYFGESAAVQKGLAEFSQGKISRASLFAASMYGSEKQVAQLLQMPLDGDVLWALAAAHCNVSSIVLKRLSSSAARLSFASQVVAEQGCASSQSYMVQSIGDASANQQQNIADLTYRSEVISLIRPLVGPVASRILEANSQFVAFNSA